MTESNTTGSIQLNFHLHYPSSHPDNVDTFKLKVDITLPGQGITAIFGHSGSGKTSLLRCVAGLEKTKQGRLVVKGETWQDSSFFLATHKRPLGYVFQESSLFPHLNGKENLYYAIKRAGVAHNQDFYQRVLETMGIESILARYPGQMSGGERQRVAIARALLIHPRLLLMDEPLASLDSARKQEIMPYLERMHTHFDIPVLYVSHSLDEVARLADHTLVLDQGRVVAQGDISEIFSRVDLPMNFDEDTGVILTGKVKQQDQQWHLSRVAISGGDLWVRDAGDAINQSVRLRILARDVSLAEVSHDDTSILNRLAVEIVEIAPDRDEAMCLIRLQFASDFIIARITRRSVAQMQLQPGKKLWAQIKSVAIVR